MYFECAYPSDSFESSICLAYSTDGRAWNVWGTLPNDSSQNWRPSATGLPVAVLPSPEICSTKPGQSGNPSSCPYGIGFPSAIVMPAPPPDNWQIWFYYYYYNPSSGQGPVMYRAKFSPNNLIQPLITEATNLTGPFRTYAVDSYRGTSYLATRGVGNGPSFNHDYRGKANYYVMSADGLNFESTATAHALPFAVTALDDPNLGAAGVTNAAFLTDVHGHLLMGDSNGDSVTLLSSQDYECPFLTNPFCQGNVLPGHQLFAIRGTFQW